MIHLTQQQISSYLDGELTEASAELVRLHLASCETCTLSFARAEEQFAQLAQVLTHDPGPDFFADFAGEVESLIRTGKVEPRPARRSAPAKVAAKVEVSEPPAPVAEAAPRPRAVEAERHPEPRPEPAPPPTPASSPVTPAPLVPPQQTPAPAATPAPEAKRLKRRSEDARRPVPAIPWYAAAILALIAGSVGVMISRTPLPQISGQVAPPPAPRPAAEVQAPTETQAPVPTSETASAPLASAPALSGPASPEKATVDVATPEPAAVMPKPVVDAPIENTAATKAVVPPTPRAPRKKEPPATELLVPEPMRTLVPVTRVVTVVETTGVPSAAPKRVASPTPSILKRPPAPPAEPDPLTAATEDLSKRVRAARQATTHANEDPTAANYESAAEKWEALVIDLRGQPTQPRARFQLAAARFGAWEMHPNPQRAASAVAALRLCLVFPGTGTERDSARAWLARLSH